MYVCIFKFEAISNLICSYQISLGICRRKTAESRQINNFVLLAHIKEADIKYHNRAIAQDLFND